MARQPMTAGRLRDRVRIERPVTTADSRKQDVTTWEPVGETWACVESLSGRELWQAAQVQADLAYKVTIRFRPDVMAAGGTLRLVWVTCQNFVLNVVQAAAPEGPGRVWLELYCRGEGVKA